MYDLRNTYLHYFFAILTGILTGVAFYGSPFYWLEWLALAPLFFAIQGVKPGKAAVMGLIAGMSAGLVFFLWVFPASSRFMGRISALSLFFYLFLSFLYTLLPAGYTLFFFRFCRSKYGVDSPVWQIFSAGALWIVLEWLHSVIFAGIPWTMLYPVFSQCPNPALLQLAGETGGAGISFIIVIFNYLIYMALSQKRLRYALTGGIIFAFLFCYGILCMDLWQKRPAGSVVKISILQENIAAEARWNDATADSLAQIFLDLNRQAVEQKPDLILWSETAVPWTFRSDDDLLNEALRITIPSGARHVLGMLTEAPDNPENVYNSAYYIEPDGRVTGITHKMQLLTFLEKPILDWSFLHKLRIPVYRFGLQKNLLAGKERTLLKTAFGNAGVMICNETLTSEPGRLASDMGANFLLAMNNDAWFADKNLPRLHFDITVLRAVENRRDIAVSSNGGYGGFISASGKVMQKHKSRKPECISGEIQPRNKLTLYSRYGNFLVCICFILLIIKYIYSAILQRSLK